MTTAARDLGICRAIGHNAGDVGEAEAIMSWAGQPVVSVPSAAGDGIRHLYVGPSLVGVLRDDGAQYVVLWRRGHADEPKWMRPAETAYDTAKDAAMAALNG